MRKTMLFAMLLLTKIMYSQITDIEGNKYKTVTIGKQIWMAENLKTTTYANGDPIHNITDSTEWSNLTTGAWCYYNNDSSYNTPYGKLYNWYTVTDSRNVCPSGWHVPNDSDWTILANYLGFEEEAGGKMKSKDKTWKKPNVNATNSSGFSGFAGGYRKGTGTYCEIGINGVWWSSTESSMKNAWSRGLFYKDGYLFRSYVNKVFGMSVRCIKD